MLKPWHLVTPVQVTFPSFFLTILITAKIPVKCVKGFFETCCGSNSIMAPISGFKFVSVSEGSILMNV